MAANRLKAPWNLKIEFSSSPRQFELWKLLQPDYCPHCGGDIAHEWQEPANKTNCRDGHVGLNEDRNLHFFELLSHFILCMESDVFTIITFLQSFHFSQSYSLTQPLYVKE